MRYVAEIKEDKFIVTGIKEMETINGDKVEVKIDSKEYEKEKLEEVIKSYTQERDLMYEQYSNNLEDLGHILEAIELVEGNN